MEQKFVLDAGKVSELKFALLVPLIGQILGIFFMVIGVTLLSVKNIKKILAKKSRLEMTDEAVKMHEVNSLLTKN